MDPLSYYKSPPKRVVLGHLNHNGSSPISPMANLKLLTKVATSHFSMEENKDLKSVEEVEVKNNKNCRRFRSLSFICQKFLVLYRLDIPNGQFRVISLGNLAASLGIEKRRVYDIINVVASLKMAVRLCKDKYKWFGGQNLIQHLSELKAYAIQNRIDQEVDRLVKYQEKYHFHDEICYESFDAPKIPVGPEKSDDNRIGVLCQKFMMMFLVNETALNLSGVSKLILSPEQGKTGMRRLYDVANVLETLGLIKRYGKINKKPTFVYCGPKIELSQLDLTKECLVPEIHNVDYSDTSSESSSDVATFRKIDSMLQVVCTELEKFDDGPKAKRRLCLDSKDEEKEICPMKDPPSFIKTPPSFIKAPTQSFRFVCNQITKKPSDESNHSGPLNKFICLKEKGETKVPLKTLTLSQFKGSTIISADKKGNGEILVNKIQQPIKLYRPIKKLFPLNLHGGGATYRVVKSGEIMKLIKCDNIEL